MAVRARQAREVFKLIGSDAPHPQVQKLIEGICEEQHRLQQSLTEAVSLVNMVVDNTDSFMLIANNMKQELEKYQRNQEVAHPEQGSVTE